MEIHIETSPVETLSADALAVICFETEEKKEPETIAVRQEPTSDPPVAAQGGWLGDLRASGEFTGKLGNAFDVRRGDEVRGQPRRERTRLRTPHTPGMPNAFQSAQPVTINRSWRSPGHGRFCQCPS